MLFIESWTKYVSYFKRSKTMKIVKAVRVYLQSVGSALLVIGYLSHIDLLFILGLVYLVFAFLGALIEDEVES